ncbi:MAG: BMP family ABC transporter substrate-binding protein [Anaerolineae bacterium]|nr:BMP family ABC transporter substrate-binding protein [Anaerolineae bacterium]
MKTWRRLTVLCVLAAMLIGTGVAAAQQDEFVFGLVLVGPKDDHGWSEAHYAAGEYVMENIPGTRMVVFESLNPADAPETTLEQVVDSMVAEGAKLIFTTSDAFELDTPPVAEKYPDVVFINISGSNVLEGEAPDNLGNIMGEMEWGKEIAGCAAALATQTGKIGYLGPLINFETRRLAASAYLGAKYCYETYAGKDPAELEFTVTWIGFWFNIPGVTLNPTDEVNRFFDAGVDVVISGIDTTEAIVEAGRRAEEGEVVWAIPYDYVGSCAEAPEICLGVPFFNWGPAYIQTVQAVMDGTWEQSWDWNPPDWEDLNNPDTTAAGYVYGDGLTDEQMATLDEFIAMLAEVAAEGNFALWQGPLALQDGTIIAEEGEWVDPIGTKEGDPVGIWYLPQLLEGMQGASTSE